jgi:hypothetical protein
MKKCDRISATILAALLAVMGPAALASSHSQAQPSQSSQQSSAPAQAQPEQKKADTPADAAKKPEKEKPKPKKVYTEEDMSSLKGGVSVVGDGNAGAGGAAGTRQSNGNTKAGVVPMSGQDEDYWRGKARAILDAMAATDQEIAKTKDEIKKYGNDGFDAQSGRKDNVVYIESRSGKLQQLEKRKADLEKKMDQLQEEGRKAGAESSWFR